ncbi:leukotriene B4 receptor 1-like [Neolamprologus brichardi]|uniref:Zgc:194202 n=1 Tax=Neolamprologus brichardi TaxID=32507 RepID=A0A3Q4N6T6_NEOBR|nr:leukotriene B4 receptor 1-like [Neolamprologus brichardi]
MAQLTNAVVTSNISSSPGYSPHFSWDYSGIAATVVMSISFLLGFPGNIAVIILKPNWENMSSLTQSLMLNLAVSGLLCMFTVPFWIYSLLNSWALGLVGCKIITYFGYCSIYASLLTVTVMSVQRYFQVVYLQRNLNHVQAWKLLVPLWLVAMILSIPALVVRQLVQQSDWTYCKHQYYSVNQSMAVLLTEIVVGFVSVSVNVFSYICLYREVNQAAFFNNPQTTRLITSIIVTFFVVWVPCLAINVLGVAAISLNNKDLLKFCEAAWGTVTALTFANGAVNPLLYAFTSNRLSTLCQRNAEHLMQKLRIPPQSKSANTVSDVR